MRPRSALLIACALVTAALVPAGPASAVSPTVTFDAAFAPATIGPGSTTMLTFTITNSSGTAMDSVAFTDALPAGVTIADPTVRGNGCNGTLDAPDGGSTIAFSAGRIGSGTTCATSVAVTASTAGTHTNTTGTLTSSTGSHGTASADLTVAQDRPGFTAAFAPATVAVGQPSTLTFTIDNSANASRAVNAVWADTLPAGVAVANPPNARTTCDSALFAPSPGDTSLSFQTAVVPAGTLCTASVNVVSDTPGTRLVTQTGQLTSSDSSFVSRTSGFATAALTAAFQHATVTFVDDPAAPGSTVRLRFALHNNGAGTMSGVSFTDDLDATLSGLVATGLPRTDVCGTGSSLTGTSLLTLTGGTLASGTDCQFDVALSVPAGASFGTYTNTTSTITGGVSNTGSDGRTGPGGPFFWSPVSDDLVVAPVPTLTTAFVDDPVAAGATTAVTFTLTNTSPTDPLSDGTFSDPIATSIPGAAPTNLPANGFCGTGSQAAVTSGSLRFAGLSLAAGDQCTFQVGLQLGADVTDGEVTNTTSEVRGTVGGTFRWGRAASDTTTVVAAPRLTIQALDPAVAPGDTVRVRYTLTQGENAPGPASDIGFTDDLDTALSGLTATGPLPTDPCGPGSQLAGAGTLTLTGGTLSGAGDHCTFEVTLQVPADATHGTVTSTTSPVSATVAGLTAARSPASTTFRIVALRVATAFTDGPAVPGGTTTLSFTIENVDPAGAASMIAFQDDLDAVLSGLTATGVPADNVCGAGSRLTGTSTLSLSGGNLAPGDACTFDVPLHVPSTAVPGEYRDATGMLTADVGGDEVGADPTRGRLTVVAPLALDMTFAGDAAIPGGTATLQFTVTNRHPSAAATGLGFSDDLDAALGGLTATNLPADPCGTGSQLSGGSTLRFTGGSLPANGSCHFEVGLQLPGATASGTTVTDTTSSLTGTIDGEPATGAPASDDLLVSALTLDEAVSGPVVPGRTTELTFTITNHDASNPFTGLAFTDDLDATLPGLTADGLPAADVCGTGSTLAGGAVVTFTGGQVAPGGDCTFTVTVTAPADAAPGSYTDATSTLTRSGLPIGVPASTTLTVAAPPVVATPPPPNTPADLADGCTATPRQYPTDLTTTDTHGQTVGCLLALDILQGYPDGTFRPGNVLTRGQAATVLTGIADTLGLGLETNVPHAFLDDGGPHGPDLDRLHAAGIIAGFDDGTVGPSLAVSRAQLASMLVRFVTNLTDRTLPDPAEGYDDVAGTTHEHDIGTASALGLFGGLPDGSFEPAAPTSRAQAGTVFARLLVLLGGPVTSS